MNNLKQFLIWWAKDSTQSIRKHWPAFQFRLLQFIDYMAILTIVGIMLFTIVAIVGYYVSTSGPWIYYSTLAAWAIAPVLYLLSRYFYFKWQEWQREQERLVETLSRKNFSRRKDF